MDPQNFYVKDLESQLAESEATCAQLLAVNRELALALAETVGVLSVHPDTEVQDLERWRRILYRTVI